MLQDAPLDSPEPTPKLPKLYPFYCNFIDWTFLLYHFIAGFVVGYQSFQLLSLLYEEPLFWAYLSKMGLAAIVMYWLHFSLLDVYWQWHAFVRARLHEEYYPRDMLGLPASLFLRFIASGVLYVGYLFEWLMIRDGFTPFPYGTIILLGLTVLEYGYWKWTVGRLRRLDLPFHFEA